MPHPLTQYLPKVSRWAYGCMGLSRGQDSISSELISQTHKVVDTALETGINFFDHADIYGMGKAEQLFSKVLSQRPELRQQLYLQSKCSIRFEDALGPGRYDCSEQWIIESAHGILTRLNTEYLDVLLLHRPDPLMEPEEVAKAFSHLHNSGKVRFFGVSNMHHHQLAFLQSTLDQPLIANQVEISLKHLAWLDEGVLAGHPAGSEVNFASGTLEYCRAHGIQIQSWGSLCQGLFSGADISKQEEHVRRTAALVQSMAEQLGASREAVVLAWLLRHPAKIQAIVGTTNTERLRNCSQAENISLSREQWYQLYVSSRGHPLP